MTATVARWHDVTGFQWPMKTRTKPVSLGEPCSWKGRLPARCVSGDISTAISPWKHVGRRNCTELRNEGSRNCSSTIVVQQAIRSVHARRHKASNATGTGRVSLAQPPLEQEPCWEAEFALVLLVYGHCVKSCLFASVCVNEVGERLALYELISYGKHLCYM